MQRILYTKEMTRIHQKGISCLGFQTGQVQSFCLMWTLNAESGSLTCLTLPVLNMHQLDCSVFSCLSPIMHC